MFEKISCNGNQGVNGQAEVNASFGANFLGKPAKPDGEGGCQELHHQQGANQGGLADANLCTVNGCHGDDGSNAIGINPEGKQEKRQVAEPADVLEGFCQPAEACLDGLEIFFAWH